MFVVEKAFADGVREYMLGPFVMNVKQDTAAPMLSSATLQGLTLTATFDETILLPDNPKFSVYAQDTATGGVGLSHITPNISGDTATFTLTLDEVQRIADLTDPQFIVFADAVQDFSGNYVLLRHRISLDVVGPVPTADDTAGPEFVSGTMDRVGGLLTVTFNEPVDVTPQSQVNVTGLTITDGTDTVPLGGATLNTMLDSPTIAIQLTAGQQTVPGRPRGNAVP